MEAGGKATIAIERIKAGVSRSGLAGDGIAQFFQAWGARFKQNKKMAQTKKQRVERLLESIYTISLAMEQQQCNLSEGSIRLYHLHESLPIDDKPDFQGRYPGLYALYAKVSDLPTHEARDKLSTLERRNQDDMREAIESELESQILKDVAKLKAFTP